MMLERSPKSKVVLVSSICFGILAIYFFLDSIVAMRSLTARYGERQHFLIAASDIYAGEEISADSYETKEMFVTDSPEGAIRANNYKDSIALTDIKKGTILTQHMVDETLSQSLSEKQSMIFIPTQEKINQSLSTKADLLAYSPDLFGAKTIATNATLVYEDSEDISGYWFIVTKEEALEITQALSVGDVRIAMIKD